MEPVSSALRRAAERDLLPPASRILLAVSGGADSMALLYGCLEVADEARWRLVVGHVHHGLRGREADRDLAFVSEHARRTGLPFLFRRRDARGEARALGLSLEAAARRVRYEALREMEREAGAQRIAVAHQADDVAESHVLARRRRGGVAALAGPRERRADGVVRPLLGVTREQVLAFLRKRETGFRRDASNGNLRFERNRVRRALARNADPAVAVAALATQAAWCAAQRDSLERDYERLAPLWMGGPGVAAADAEFLAGCSRDLVREALSDGAAPFAAAGRPALTGREREQILDRIFSGADFRFEAGRRIRFERRGRLLRVALRPPAGPRRAARV